MGTRLPDGWVAWLVSLWAPRPRRTSRGETSHDEGDLFEVVLSKLNPRREKLIIKAHPRTQARGSVFSFHISISSSFILPCAIIRKLYVDSDLLGLILSGRTEREPARREQLAERLRGALNSLDPTQNVRSIVLERILVLQLRSFARNNLLPEIEVCSEDGIKTETASSG